MEKEEDFRGNGTGIPGGEQGWLFNLKVKKDSPQTKGRCALADLGKADREDPQSAAIVKGRMMARIARVVLAGLLITACHA